MLFSLFDDFSGSVEIEVLNFFNMSLECLFVHAFLVVCLCNHFHGLNVLSLSPFGHCPSTVALPEHSS